MVCSAMHPDEKNREALLVRCVSNEFGSVLFKKSAKQHLLLLFFCMFKGNVKHVVWLCGEHQRFVALTNFFRVCVSHHSVRWLASVALTFNSLECWAAFEIQKNLCNK